jgi:hypothetical protein
MYLPLIFRRWILSAINSYATQKKNELVFYAFGFSFPEKTKTMIKDEFQVRKGSSLSRFFLYVFGSVRLRKCDKKSDLVNGYIQFKKICFKIAKNTL